MQNPATERCIYGSVFILMIYSNTKAGKEEIMAFFPGEKSHGLLTQRSHLGPNNNMIFAQGYQRCM